MRVDGLHLLEKIPAIDDVIQFDLASTTRKFLNNLLEYLKLDKSCVFRDRAGWEVTEIKCGFSITGHAFWIAASFAELLFGKKLKLL